MENIITIIIVAVVVLWACWSTYRTLTGKKSGCSCASSCNKNDCAESLKNKNES